MKRIPVAAPAAVLAALGLALAPVAALATTIAYDLSPLGGNAYRYTYTVFNDSLAGPLTGFQIAFADAGGLALGSPPSIAAFWDEYAFPPVLSDPAAYDASTQQGGIAAGDRLGGFTVYFTWNGAGRPGAQRYEIYDPQTFTVLDRGNTVVPLPGALGLLGAGLGVLGMPLLRGRRARRGARS